MASSSVSFMVERLATAWPGRAPQCVPARAERSMCSATSRRGRALAIASRPASRRGRRCATGTDGSNRSCRVAETRSLHERGEHTLECACTQAPEAGRLQYRQGKSRHLDVLRSNALDHGHRLAFGRPHRLARRPPPFRRHQALTPTRMTMLLPCTVQEVRSNGTPGF